MKRISLLFVLACCLPTVVSAQSLFSTHGLGVPTAAIDARARALGINGVGLLGLSTSLVNPAEPAGLLRRGVTASFQPWTGSTEFDGEEGDVSGTRFPVIRILYPTRGLVLGLGYGGMLDQSWAVFAEREVDIGNDTVTARDLVRAAGGIGELRFDVAYRFGDRFALGAGVGLHTGNMERSITRAFPDTLFLRPFVTRSRWDYTAPLATVGFRWDLDPALRLGAALTWSGELEAEPQVGSTTSFSYDMPLRFAAGVSGRLGPELLLALSTNYTGWGSGNYAAPGSNVAVVAEDAWDFGGGLEWQGLRTSTRVFPIRLGVRNTKLPFHATNQSAASEFLFSGGIGFRLVEDEFGPLAVADVGLERGSREGWESTAAPDGLTENFWRFTVSLSLFGR